MHLRGRNNRILAHGGAQYDRQRRRWGRVTGAFARMLALFVVLGLAMSGSGAETFAQIANEDSLYESTWNYLFEDATVNNGVIQSICATSEYLITIENTSEDPTIPDTVSAYYKNPFDRNGNAVQQYSLAMRNTDYDWEHGNGMAYNPNTNEIYVALYSNAAGDNEGTLYIMDPDTLSYKGKIKIAEGYNILGIDYDNENDQYYTLTDASANYTLQRRDASFNLIEDLGPVDPAPGNNFQDICLSGDYIFLSPLTYGMGIGDFMNIYSVSRRETLVSVNMNMGLEDPYVEAEGVCMAQKGMFVCPVTVTREDGSRYLYFYQMTLPWLYTIETSARGLTYEGERTIYTVDNGEDPVNTYTMDMELYTGNGNGVRPLSENGNGTDSNSEEPLTIGGTVSAGSSQVLSGTSFTVTFKPDTGYKVAAVYLDATKLDLPEGTNSYTLENIDGNHRITVEFIPTAKPTSTPTPSPSTTPSSASENDGGANATITGDESDQSGSLSGTNIAAGEQAGEQADLDSSRRTSTRNKAVLFVILILLILVFGLGLFVLYTMHVRRVREQQRQAHREERRLRRLREEAEEAEKAGGKRVKKKEREERTGGVRRTGEAGVGERTGSVRKSGEAGMHERTGRVRKSGEAGIAGRAERLEKAEKVRKSGEAGMADRTDKPERLFRTRKTISHGESKSHDKIWNPGVLGETEAPAKVRKPKAFGEVEGAAKRRKPKGHADADNSGRSRKSQTHRTTDNSDKVKRSSASRKTENVDELNPTWMNWDKDNIDKAIDSWLYGDNDK